MGKVFSRLTLYFCRQLRWEYNKHFMGFGSAVESGKAKGSGTLRKRKSTINVVEDKNKMAKTDASKTSEQGEVMEKLAKKLGITIVGAPRKSESDSKEYLTIILPNALRAVLVSDVKNLVDLENEIEEGGDEESCDESEGSTDDDEDEVERKLAACALTVGVGSFSDPEDVPGLAHFLEHMLFMGSKKYPKENDFDTYVSSNGGYSNAQTECQYTTYYFTSPEPYLKKSMDKFAQFFISPLLRRESMVREREAVESEFKLTMLSDSSRREQIFATTAPDNNPAHKFMWGNLISLQQNVTDDHLYKSLRDFWEHHYSSHRMTLSVQARLSLELLAEYVVECFGEVPRNDLPPDEFLPIVPPFIMEKFHSIYTIEPVKDINKLTLTWALPPVVHLYRAKPIEYLAYLIGHEGTGSLMAFLRKNLWALNITAGNAGVETGLENNSMYSLFIIDIDLTQKGQQEYVEVLKAIFGYIKLLKQTGPQETVYKDLKHLRDIEFRYRQECEADDNVEELCQNMQFYQPEDYITGDTLVYEYKPEHIDELVKKMTPEAVNVMISSKKSSREVDLNQIEPWFNTKYAVMDKKSTEKVMAKFKNVEPDPYFSLPPLNPYITTDFTILPRKPDMPEYPEKVVDDDLIEMWYKQDTVFNLPIVQVRINLITNLIKEPKHAAMLELISMMYNQIIIEEVYQASLAGFSLMLTSTEKGLLIRACGYNQKLILLMDAILDHVKHFNNKTTIGVFDAVKSELLKHYFNKTIKPKKLCAELRMGILVQPFYSSVSKHQALQSITIEELKSFVTSLLSGLYVQGLIQGNVTHTDAVYLSNRVKNTLHYSPIRKEHLPRSQVHQLPSGEFCCRVENIIPDVNCDVTNYYQMGPLELEESCKIDLLLQIMEEPLFDTLRTQEQLGYDVQCTYRDTFGILGFSITVNSQADKHSVDHVEQRMSEFLKGIGEKLENMSQEEFEQAKESVRLHKLEADTQLKQEVDRNWSEIVSRQYKFDRRKREAKCIETITVEDVKDFFTRVLSETAQDVCLRKLSVQVDGKADAEEVENCNFSTVDHNHKLQIQMVDRGGKFITNLEEFKSGLTAYPINKTYW